MSKTRFPRTQRYCAMNVLGHPARLARYYSAVDELANAIVELIENLALCNVWNRDVSDDILAVLQTRYANCGRDLCLMIAAEAELRKQLAPTSGAKADRTVHPPSMHKDLGCQTAR